MKKSALRTAGCWVPMKRSEATRVGLSVKPFAPVYHAKDFGLVLDQSVWFEASIPPRWMAAFRLVNQRGQPVIAELRLFPDEPDEHSPRRAPGRWRGEYGAPATVPPGGLTARILRAIRTQAFRGDLRSIMTRKITMGKGKRSVGKWEKDEWEMVFPSIPLSATQPRAGRGRKGRSDHELARIAAAYERAYLAGRPAIAAVAKAIGISPPQARDGVRRARTRGMLSPASKQGKGGGLLTPLAREILKHNAKDTGGKRHGTKR